MKKKTPEMYFYAVTHAKKIILLDIPYHNTVAIAINFIIFLTFL